MHKTDLEGLARVVYDTLLAQAFPPEQLQPRAEFVRDVLSGVFDLVVDDPDRPSAAAVGERVGDLALLGWLATVADRRGGGLGRRVLTSALVQWQSTWQPRMILAEVENPVGRSVSAHGDPIGRVRFYDSFGARALQLPYFQPAVRPGGLRVEGMMLVVLRLEGEPPPQQVPGGPIRAFLESYLDGDEADEARARLLAAANGPVIDTIALGAPVAELPARLPSAADRDQPTRH